MHCMVEPVSQHPKHTCDHTLTRDSVTRLKHELMHIRLQLKSIWAYSPRPTIGTMANTTAFLCVLSSHSSFPCTQLNCNQMFTRLSIFHRSGWRSSPILCDLAQVAFWSTSFLFSVCAQSSMRVRVIMSQWFRYFKVLQLELRIFQVDSEALSHNGR